MKTFENNTIWVTGASSGIGKALAMELNASGANLIISSRNITDLNAVKALCRFPDRVAVLALDLADMAAMPELVKNACALFGSIDILINNAGISQRSLIKDTPIAVLERLIRINYLGTVALTNALLPHFISRQKGHFVTVTSLMGKFGSPYRSGYCAAKHALHGYMDVLRMEHQEDGVEVTLICPGFVRTDVARNALTASGRAQGSDDKATAKGMAPEIFARKMLRAVKRKKFEAYIGGKEIAGVYLKRFFPALLHRVVLRSAVI